MSVIRAFIAINLTAEIQERLEDITTSFKRQLNDVPVRWVPSGNIHLTLKFLGDVSVANIEILTELLSSEAAGHKPFEISVGGIGAFPHNRRPRVIWVGVEAPADLLLIQNGIESAMARIGYPREERPFSPHLTLGRVSRNANSSDVHQISRVLESSKVGFLGATNVRQISLYRSDLTPKGAVYTEIYSAPLSQLK